MRRRWRDDPVDAGDRRGRMPRELAGVALLHAVHALAAGRPRRSWRRPGDADPGRAGHPARGRGPAAAGASDRREHGGGGGVRPLGRAARCAAPQHAGPGPRCAGPLGPGAGRRRPRADGRPDRGGRGEPARHVQPAGHGRGVVRAPRGQGPAGADAADAADRERRLGSAGRHRPGARPGDGAAVTGDCRRADPRAGPGTPRAPARPSCSFSW